MIETMIRRLVPEQKEGGLEVSGSHRACIAESARILVAELIDYGRDFRWGRLPGSYAFLGDGLAADAFTTAGEVWIV
jgi:hypothetical protein